MGVLRKKLIHLAVSDMLELIEEALTSADNESICVVRDEIVMCVTILRHDESDCEATRTILTIVWQIFQPSIGTEPHC